MRLARMITVGSGQKRRTTVFLVAALVLAAGLLALVGCSDDETNVTFSPEPLPPAYKWFFDVYGTAANDVWVGGSQGIMYHFDGTDWTRADMASTKAITTIWGAGDGAMYACGHGGAIWRNTGGGWGSMASGTGENLYGLGSYDGTVHAVGHEGTIRRLGTGGWGGVATSLITRDPTRDNAAIDTLSLTQDVSSLVTVNHFFIGGAYFLPNFEGEELGTDGTDGMVLTADVDDPPEGPRFDWLLRPVRGSRTSNTDGRNPEWIYCTTSDEANTFNNYLGTSKGWLFQLEEDALGVRTWEKNIYRVTESESQGIRDMWIDGGNNLYIVTEDGQVVYQSADGERELLYDQKNTLVGIWGTGPENIYLVGYMDEQILHAVHDTVGVGSFDVTVIPLSFPEKSAFPGLGLGTRPEFDEIGRPRF